MIPQITALILAAVAAREYSTPAKDAARGVQMTCQEKYCAPLYMIHVDRPQNTLMRDDRASSTGGLNSHLAAAYQLSKRTYYEEAHSHPGVQLVAHTVS